MSSSLALCVCSFIGWLGCTKRGQEPQNPCECFCLSLQCPTFFLDILHFGQLCPQSAPLQVPASPGATWFSFGACAPPATVPTPAHFHLVQANSGCPCRWLCACFAGRDCLHGSSSLRVSSEARRLVLGPEVACRGPSEQGRLRGKEGSPPPGPRQGAICAPCAYSSRSHPAHSDCRAKRPGSTQSPLNTRLRGSELGGSTTAELQAPHPWQQCSIPPRLCEPQRALGSLPPGSASLASNCCRPRGSALLPWPVQAVCFQADPVASSRGVGSGCFLK